MEPKEWKQNKRKNDRQSGKEYVSVKGAVKLKPVLCQNKLCVRSCSEINKENTHIILSSFWSMSDLNSRRRYISSSIDKVDKATTRLPAQSSRHYCTLQYHLF